MRNTAPKVVDAAHFDTGFSRLPSYDFRLREIDSDDKGTTETAMSDFKRLAFSDAPGGATAACERLPDTPAIYAFFSSPPKIVTANKEAFIEAVIALVEQNASPTLSAKAGSLHKLTLDNCSTLSSHKRDVLDGLAESAEIRTEISKIIDRSMALRSPLYVGQTASLRTRIKTHLQPSSGLACRLRSSDINIDTCILAYHLMPDIKLFQTDESLTLTEEIVTRILRPGFVARIG